MSSNGSPFLVLWYLYLAFFGSVLIIHIVCKAAGGVVGWRVRTLMRTKMKLPTKIEVRLNDPTEPQRDR